MRCWWVFFHDWAKWEFYTWRGLWRPLLTGGVYGEGIECSEYRQRRSCKACGYTQDRKVRG